MRKAIIALGSLSVALLAGCRAQESAVAVEPISYKFEATVLVNPTQPVPNQRVNLNLEVTSSSSQAVTADVLLRVLSDKNEVLYDSTWPEVLFHENEVWNLTQGFLPPSDAGRTAWHVQITLTEHETNEVLYDQTIAKLNFKR